MPTETSRNSRGTSVRSLSGVQIWDVAPSFLVAVAFLLPGAVDVGGPYLDSGVYSQVGKALRSGGVLYIDAWDHKPPGIFVIDALSQAVMPFASPWIAAWVASVGCTWATLVLIAVVLREDGVSRIIGLALCAASACLTVYPVAVGGGLAEVPALVLAMGAIVAVRRRRTGFGRPLLAGVLAAGACLVVPQAVSAALAALYLAQVGRAKNDRAWAIGAFALGVAAVTAITGVWLFAVGALPAAVDAVVTYNGVYVQLNREGLDLRGLVSPLVLSLGCLACLLVPAIVIPMNRHGEWPSRSRLANAALIWLVVFAGLTAAQGRISPHYFLLAVPPLTILAAPMFDEAFREPRLRARRGALLAVLAGVVVTTLVVTVTTQRYFTRFPNRDQVGTVGEWLRTNTREGTTIFAWGNQPFLYDISGRQPASKYLVMLPLTTPGYSSLQQIHELVDHLQAAPPQAIIDAGSSLPGEPGWLPLLIPRSVVRIDGRELDLLEPLRAFVREHYHLADVVDGWPIYLHD